MSILSTIRAWDRRTQVLIAFAVVILLAALIGMFAAEPQVAVKIYKHTESGNLIYCETGTLNDEFHTYEGEGKIGESKAVAC